MMEKKRNPGSHQISVLCDLVDGDAIWQVRRQSKTSKMGEITVLQLHAGWVDNAWNICDGHIL